jgi:hypothetical protein
MVHAEKLISAVFLLAPATLFAQLSLPVQSAGPGASIILTVAYQPQGQTVAAIQFDLTYDASVLSLTVTPGEAARNSGKSITYASVAPNKTRIIVIGENQHLIPPGPLVNLSISLSLTASSGAHPLAFSAALGADPDGNPVAISSADGAIVVQGISVASVAPSPTPPQRARTQDRAHKLR